eukprot:TRINITY_DN21590_c0_g1_i1.p1 TRINITY_DN21590_c0_g1~~TRINITY_DN21590_c0_g1_i1.p1  ORF type:complete len:560 (+),score=107.40 TRINITY_DN21590_c0_g1_i1:69-1748(+)
MAAMRASAVSFILISACLLSSPLVFSAQSGAFASHGSSKPSATEEDSFMNTLLGFESPLSHTLQSLSSNIEELYGTLRETFIGRTTHDSKLVQESERWEVKSQWRGKKVREGEEAGEEIVEEEEEDADDDSNDEKYGTFISPEGFRREEQRLEQRLASVFNGYHFNETWERAGEEEEEGTRRRLVEEDTGEEELDGDFYYNKDVFKRTYADMEKNLKIFVYSDGQSPLTHFGTLTDTYSMDALFMHYLKPELTSFVTEDAKEANIFFVPISFVSLVTYLWEPPKGRAAVSMKPMKSYVAAYVDMISHKYPYFDASAGKDHFIVSCHDWAPQMTKGHRSLHRRSMRVMCNANVSYDFASTRDVPLPSINIPKAQYPKKFGGPRPPKRHLNVFYAGNAEGKIRKEIHRVWRGRGSGFRIYEGFTGKKDDMTYIDHVRRSKYCLCPGGESVNTARIIEAIYNDCVPVIASPGLVLPFSDVIDWAKFSVIIYYKQIPQLSDILQNIPRKQYIKMHYRLGQVRKHLIINTPPKKYDVFHMVLHSLWLRHLQRQDKSGPFFAEEA